MYSPPRTKRAVQKVWQMLSVFLACWLFGCVAFQFNPRTPSGVQCPTATVQTVTVAVRDCCNRVTYKRVVPKPGDRNFVQCRCLEKKSTGQQAAVNETRLDPYIPEPLRFELPIPPSESRTRFVHSETLVSVENAPSDRPPAFA